ncbi:AAA family ATPase [Bifidobacterium avesanii]|uniref:Chromosome partition protein Smc n=1 Tax=Bifidobacterium avesanii TaxID=1798157 RepID=A0A7K3TJH9_9BIFI|nr:AAA family ATPase [Bifidobacterium avesanii]KAB8291003.1 chromosome segregation protein SMC [Bifidobacterium avesanii]NEG78770.1 AAA family ATPase [Bifidobacterium avesanii]
MYLKELTLRGFKSFASATTLRFEPGITAVVGPNGSGKSNIVDALAWVMGEQGAKALRGAQMEDVIFAGTSSRPPLGRAQVTLTIDNTDHALDIDYTEVTISRTIFRNGGSEYAINGSACRLLDIQELLSDTGLGQQMHVIVGQGRLDAILKADPSGHRAFIEEAAGILKHRKRKERALRKLANTERNLARLDDLLGEIHRQLGPLGRQARISRRAEAIQVTVRDAQSRLYAEDAVLALKQRDELRGELADVRSHLASAQRELAGVKVRIEQVEALASEASPAIARVNEIWHRYAQLQERYRSLAQVAGERARSLLGQVIDHLGDDPDLLERRAAELDGQARTQRDAVADARLALDRATESRADDERKLASVRQTLTELRKSARQRESRIAQLNTLIAREEAAVELAETRAKDFDAQRAALGGQLDDARAQHAALSHEAEATTEADEGKALDDARTALAARQETLDGLLDEQRTLNGRIISLKAKADALNDTLDSRNASGELERDAAVGALGRLADFIRVEDGWEEAVAHALDAFAGALVVPGTANMLHALRRAREDKLGRAVVLAADGGLVADGAGLASAGQAGRAAHDDRAHDDRAHGRDGGGFRSLGELVHGSGAVVAEATAGAEDGGDSPDSGEGAGSGSAVAGHAATPDAASDATDAASGVVAAVRLLLADVAAVESLDEAQSALSAGWRTAATRDGEIVNAVAAAGGSSLSQSDLSLAARRDRALAQMHALEDELGALDVRVEQAKSERDEARLAVDRESSRRTEMRLKAQQAAKSLRAAADRVAGCERQVKAMDGKIAAVREDGETHRLKLDDLRLALEVARESDGDGADSDELAARETALEHALAATREQEVTAKIAWNEAKRKVDSLERQAGLLHDQAKEAVDRRARVEALNAKRREQAAHARSVADDATEIAELIGRYIADATARRDALQAEASSHDDELKALRGERDRIEPKVGELTAREHALDVDRERVAGQCGQITQKIADDLGMDVDGLIAQYGPDQPVPVLDEQGRPVPVVAAADQGADSAGEATGTTQSGEHDGQTGSSKTADSRNDAAGTVHNGPTEPANPGESPETAYQTVPYDRAEQRKRLDKARRDLAALGKVNPLATEEYDALQTRNQYLNDQRNDVVQSRDDLMGLIKDLDSTMVEVFRSAFDDTAKAFERMFGMLFPGGRGRLRLENPDDLLTTGVLVEASPAGKRVKQLSLLSGGERSLTALALLFAIFTARPSPFYVMDEVEAALDDVNLTRLINAFNDLREHAQLIIITHQQRTMSIADALYGVTMRADGVTAVVSQRLER